MTRRAIQGMAWLLAAAFLAATQGPAAAQDGSDGEREGNEPTKPAERIFRYLDDAVFLVPGRGLGRVTLGIPLASVVQALGAPSRSDRSGFFNPTTTLLYEAGIDAWLLISGDETVERIGLEGRSGIATAEGVRYGMPGHQVSMIYGEPVITEEGELRYPERGVAFTLRSGTVFQIEVFTPEARAE